MGGKFTFVFTEKEASIIQDALECYLEYGVGTPDCPYPRYDVEEFTAYVNNRLEY